MLSKYKKTAYLIGPIEGASDYGKGWRESVVPRLAAFGIGVFDPTGNVVLGGTSDIYERREKVDNAKKSHDWTLFTSLMDDIWRWNHEAVLGSDFLIAHFPERPAMGGTLREMQKAFDYEKPVYLVYESDPVSINAHVLHMILKRGAIFTSFDEFFEFLRTQDC